jgi:hypothetical protein
MRQIAISVWLGFLALPAFFFGVLPFDVNGQPTPLKGIVSGCAAVALCLAVCQFLVARRSGREAAASAAATGMFTAGQRPRETSVLLASAARHARAGCRHVLPGVAAGPKAE